MKGSHKDTKHGSSASHQGATHTAGKNAESHAHKGGKSSHEAGHSGDSSAKHKKMGEEGTTSAHANESSPKNSGDSW